MENVLNNQKIQLLVIQPTPFCNINCNYCYLPNRSSNKRISLQIIDLIGSKIIHEGWCAPDVTVVWHSGEPTVIPPAWYHTAFEVLQKYCPPNIRLTHAFQTNGLLLNKEWLDLFKTWNIRIGVSIDGFKELHDANRITRDGKGTWESTVRGIRMLRAAGIPFHVITVLTNSSLKQAKELFEFYQSEGIDRVCFNVEEIEGININSTLVSKETEINFKHFLANFMDYMQKTQYPIWVREFAYSLGTILKTENSPIPNQQVMPLAIVSIDVNGNLSTFSPELLGFSSKPYGNFSFSSLQNGGIAEMLNSEFFQAAYHDITQGVKECQKNCEWFNWCGGGAPANKLFENGSFASTETMYCRLTKKVLLETVLDAIENNKLPEAQEI